jgi:hypothetical protein
MFSLLLPLLRVLFLLLLVLLLPLGIFLLPVSIVQTFIQGTHLSSTSARV